NPPLERVPELLETNRRRLGAPQVKLLGQPLPDLRTAIQGSIAVVNEHLPLPAGVARPRWPTAPVIVSGHQPELYHPGVWLKNFAINAFARRYQAAPLHVVIDSDTIKTTSVSFPIWATDPALVHGKVELFDDWDGEVPYLGRALRNPARFQEFGASTQSIW